jgi:uncharacterized membrane protein YqjE
MGEGCCNDVAMTRAESPAGRATVAGASTASADQQTIGKLVQDASSHLSTMLHGEIELVKLELRSSVKSGGVGVAMFAAAGVLFVFALTFGLIALAEGLVAAHIWRWAAYLIVFALLLLMIGLLVLLGRRQVKRVKPPARTIEEGKQTVAMLKNPTHRPAP